MGEGGLSACVKEAVSSRNKPHTGTQQWAGCSVCAHAKEAVHLHNNQPHTGTYSSCGAAHMQEAVQQGNPEAAHVQRTGGSQGGADLPPLYGTMKPQLIQQEADIGAHTTHPRSTAGQLLPLHATG